ncbi:MAG: sigma 54-interacting transcriptional regulator [Deltaproteobacteria bacterium]|nr:sigma 54-interacting transcriptional regulator [Deltaproteobacteria bacterium]
MQDDDTQTQALSDAWMGELLRRRELVRFRLELTLPDGTRRALVSDTDRVSLGTHASNDLVIDRDTVSRFHCEIVIDDHGVRVRDLSSKNGTFVDGVRIESAWLGRAHELRLGEQVVAFTLEEARASVALSSEDHFGRILGRSSAMRRVFAMLERCASADITVLLEGESGTGKEGAAEAIHGESARKSAPFVVVDCSAIAPNLLESELFGHEKGAFTGADRAHKGAFEEAHGGTVFLDEIGEVPIELQPKLLRVLERKQVRRLGSQRVIDVDVRFVAATNRSLKREVNEGRFRQDLYFRLAVARVELPPLRERLDDLALLTTAFLDQLHAGPAQRARLLDPSFQQRLARHPWPGNVRELRNAIERALVFGEPDLQEPSMLRAAVTAPVDDVDLTYAEAREHAISRFEVEWLPAMLAKHGGNVSRAARHADLTRPYLHKLLRRHGLRGGEE